MQIEYDHSHAHGANDKLNVHNEHKGEQVVLLHGIARSSTSMSSLAKFLAKNGYVVHNLDYPSTKHRLEDLADMMVAKITQTINADKPVHFIGYSMGGLLVRAVLNTYRPDNLGLVMQLASPNHGSEVADFLKNNWLFKRIYGPAGQQLRTDDTSRDELLGKVDYTLGVIAGNFSFDPISSMMIAGPDDGKVSVESSKVEGMSDHIIVSACHTFFPRNNHVKQQVLCFLRKRSFSKQVIKFS